MTTIEIAAGNLARLRELIARYNAESARRAKALREEIYTRETYQASRDLQAQIAASIVGLLEGLGLDKP